MSSRITSQVGPEPFAADRAAHERAYGVERIGVGVLVQPPDRWTDAYDAVRLVDAALQVSGAPGQPLLDALETTVITGADGDECGDTCFGRSCSDLRFRPVTDDVLSTGLPPVEQ